MLLKSSPYLFPCLVDLLQIVEISLKRRQGLVIYLSEAPVGLVDIRLCQALRLVQRLEIVSDCVPRETSI